MPTTNWRELYRQRDALAADAPPGSAAPGCDDNPADLDRQIIEAQAELADADGALQTASPNYGQLVQQVVPAADVLAALRPDEALAAITLTKHGGWSFLLRAGSIDAAPVKGDAASITALVKRVRSEHRIAHWSAAEVRHRRRRRRCTTRRSRRWRTRLAGAKALVVAPSGRCCRCRSRCC